MQKQNLRKDVLNAMCSYDESCVIYEHKGTFIVREPKLLKRRFECLKKAYERSLKNMRDC